MAKPLPAGFKRFPIDTVEVEDVSPNVLLELGLGELIGADGLEGWGIFKKIGRAFKKIGRGIKKIARSKIFKIAIPVLGFAVLGPLVGVGIGKLTKLVGGKAAALIKAGRTRAQNISMPDGSTKVGLLTPSEAAKLAALKINPTQAITTALLKRLTGISNATGIVSPGAQIQGGKLIIPTNGPQTVTSSVIPAATSGFKKFLPWILAGGAALFALPLILRRGK